MSGSAHVMHAQVATRKGCGFARMQPGQPPADRCLAARPMWHVECYLHLCMASRFQPEGIMKYRIRSTAIAMDARVAVLVAAIPLLLIAAGCTTYTGRGGESVASAPGTLVEQRHGESKGARRGSATVKLEGPSRVDEARPPEPPLIEEAKSAGTPMSLDEGKPAGRPAAGRAAAPRNGGRLEPHPVSAQPAPVEAAPPAGASPPAGESSPPLPASPSLVDSVLRSLEWGRIAFNVPAKMQYQERHVVELLLSLTASRSELQAELETRPSAQSAEIRISNEMEAQLLGTGFVIKRIEPASQVVSRMATTRWRWEVIPDEHGTRVLHLALYAHIRIAGSDKLYVVRTFDKTIDVEITMPQRVTGFLFKNWQWLWATLLVPVAGYLWRHRKGHGGPKPASLPA